MNSSWKWLIPFLLGLLLPGWGHFYNGKLKEGITLAILFPILLIIIIMGTLYFSHSADGNRLGILLSLIIYLGIVFHGTLFNYFHKPQPVSLIIVLVSGLFIRFAIHEPLRFLSKKYLVHTHRIPSESMVNTLLAGDLIVSDTYTYRNRSSISTGDIVVFKNIVDSDLEYCKRIIGKPNDRIGVDSSFVYCNGSLLDIPFEDPSDSAQRTVLTYEISLPEQGDTVIFDTLSYDQFLFHYNLICQERRKSTITGHLYLFTNERFVETVDLDTVKELHSLNTIVANRKSKYRHLKNLKWKPYFFIDGDQHNFYEYQYDSYFLLGDNRNNSYDSRYFGPVSYCSILSHVKMVLFSLSMNPNEKGILISRTGITL